MIASFSYCLHCYKCGVIAMPILNHDEASADEAEGERGVEVVLICRRQRRTI